MYTSEFPHEDSPMSKILVNVNLPIVKTDQRKDLEKSLQLQEVENSIKSHAVMSGKTPGPDGVLQKNSPHKYANMLVNMFNHSFQQSKLPPNLTQAHITIQIKPEKEALIDIFPY